MAIYPDAHVNRSCARKIPPTCSNWCATSIGTRFAHGRLHLLSIWLDFVESVLAQANELLDQRVCYQRQGITFEYIVQFIADYFAIEQGDLLRSSKQPVRVCARSLLCFWTVQKLGMMATAIAREIGTTQPAVSRVVGRGRGLLAGLISGLQNKMGVF